MVRLGYQTTKVTLEVNGNMVPRIRDIICEAFVAAEMKAMLGNGILEYLINTLTNERKIHILINNFINKEKRR